ncbi:hypothetical protein COV94_06455 [Candidatus Woesearchaeota archaeon CG11_big_fil_rev_8_21_14_0_20_57_5]|nr:MAG: hypothetical protein COV94_06455 [Candidatus Woesearchaeota archaeon CG11_big_fil_rev_8_21_14_0_20_57_5]
MKSDNPDWENLEEVSFEIEKEAFSPKSMTCSDCKRKMSRSAMEVQIDSNIFVKVNGFECAKCHKKYIGLEESKKMDRAMVLNRIINDSISMKRKLSFDGDNYTFRVPKELTQNVEKKKIEIIPIGPNRFCATMQ